MEQATQVAPMLKALADPVRLRLLSLVASHEDGDPDPNSGGFVLFAGGDVLVSPLTDLTLSLGARIPAVNALRGYHDEGSILSAAVMVDW